MQGDFTEKFNALDNLIILYLNSSNNTKIKSQLYNLLSELMGSSVLLHQKGLFNSSLKIMFKLLESSRKISDKDLESKALYGICEIYRAKNEYKTCLEFCKKAFELSDKEKISDVKSRALNNMGLVYHEQGDFENAIDSFLAAIIIAKEKSLIHDLILQLSNVGRTYTFVGKYNLAEEYFDCAIDFSKKYDYPFGEANANNEMIILYMNIGKLNEALELAEKNLSFAEENGIVMLVKSSYNNIGSIYRKKGNYQKAIDYHKLSLKLDELIGDKKGIATSLNNIGIIYSFWNKNDLALDMLFRALSLIKELGANYNICDTMVNIAVLLLSEEIEKINLEKYQISNPKKYAINLINDAYDHAIRINDKKNLVNVLLLKYNSLTNLKEKELVISEAKNYAIELGNYECIISCLIAEATISMEKKKYKNALEKASEAKKMACKTGDSSSESLILVIIGKIYLSQKELERSYNVLSQAIGILELQTGQILVDIYRIVYRESILDI